jgi:hypothetical protein
MVYLFFERTWMSTLWLIYFTFSALSGKLKFRFIAVRKKNGQVSGSFLFVNPFYFYIGKKRPFLSFHLFSLLYKAISIHFHIINQKMNQLH